MNSEKKNTIKAIIGYQEVTREMEFNMSFSHLTEHSIVEEFLTDF